MKIATWNVNSLRVRLPQVLDWLASEQPHVLALQETKLQDEQFPAAELGDAGYEAVYAGQKTYNGVAILSRKPPIDVTAAVPGLDDGQRRIIVATVGSVRIINVYVPNGERVGSEKYRYKLHWLERLTEHVRRELTSYPHLIVLGDFNIAPEERDVHDPEAWDEQVLFSGPERAAFRRLMGAGLCDTFRLFEQADAEYSWWDYRMGAFRRNNGLRIDHVVASDGLRSACVSCRIDKGPRRHERPSDHAPVIAEFDLA